MCRVWVRVYVDVGVDVKSGEYARVAFELGAKGRGLECV